MHMPDCKHEEWLNYKFEFKDNCDGKKSIMILSSSGVALERYYDGARYYTDTYIKYVYCPLCGTKYTEE